MQISKAVFSMIAVLLVALAFASGFVSANFWAQFKLNKACCRIPTARRLVVSAKETLGLTRFYSEIGQDKWVSETIFPGLENGFFLDVGSADGTRFSNTKALEKNGWTGMCIDPFPTNMQDRSCQMFKEVVSSKSGERVNFRAAGLLGGIEDTIGIGMHKDYALKSPSVEFTTVTLGDILERAKAPRFIHFVSLDIEGAELDALKGFPFDKYQIGALAVEHNYEEPKRSQIEAFMKSHGYQRVHSWSQDDLYLPVNP
jgi:hypothetical protein